MILTGPLTKPKLKLAMDSGFRSGQMKVVLCLSFLLFIAKIACAQDAIIFFQVRPPYNVGLQDLRDQIDLTITVPGQEDVLGFLSLHIFNHDETVEIISSDIGRKQVRLLSGSNTLMGSDFDDLIDINNLIFTGVDQEEVFFGEGLPAGRYFFCFELFDATGRQISNTACTNILVNLPPVASTMSFVPPYNLPFNEYPDQLTVTLTTTQGFDAQLEMLITGIDGDVTIRKRRDVSLESGANILSGIDLDDLFSPGGFSALTGIAEQELFDVGLPEGSYLITFTLLLSEEEITSASQQFRVPPAGISMNVSIMPSFDVALEDLLSQTSLTIISDRNLTDAYATLEISGDNINVTAGQGARRDLISLEANVPATLSAFDLVDITHPAVQFEGLGDTDPLEYGLPEGNYAICFRLWDNAGQLLTEIPSCFSMNVPPTNLNMSVQAVPPFITSLENISDMLLVNVNASRSMDVTFKFQILGDNGISISGPGPSDAPEIFQLEKNIPLILRGGDLLSFFSPELLLISGAGRNDLFDQGLPEGNYQVCLFPYVVAGYPLSDAGSVCTGIFPVNYVEPPQLLTPACGEEIDISAGQLVLFNWLPAPGAPLETEYTLKIVEMRIPDQNPNDAMLGATDPPFFEEQVMGNSFLYGPGESLLEPGLTYAYQVYLDNDPDRGNYVNQGASQVCYFTVKDSSFVDDIVPDEGDDDQEVVAQKNVSVSTILENPFPNYVFPVTKVSGSLRYRFISSGSVVSFTEAASQMVDNSFIDNSTSNSTGNNVTGNNIPGNNINNQQGFIQQGNIQTGRQNPTQSPITYNPSFNEDNTMAIGSLPLGGVNVKLVSGYLVYGTYLGENVSGKFISNPWGHASETIATATTDMDGNFEFTFIQTDSLGQASTQAPNVHSTIASGTLFKVYRVVVDNPYYCSPEMNIVVQPWEHLEVGSLVSFVRSYNLKVVSKTGAPFAFFADQLGGVGATIPLALTTLERTNGIASVPENEGQDLDGAIVAEGTTDAKGEIVFTNLVNHNSYNPLDNYLVTCATNENIGEYNFQTKNQTFPSTNPPGGAYADQSQVYFNSDWQIVEYVDTITLNPKLPRVFGEVSGVQPPAELTASQSNPSPDKSGGSSLSRSASNSSVNNFMSTMVYQSGLSMGEFSNVFEQIPNWSEEVNKAPLPDVKVNLWEINKYWQTNNTQPVNKLQQISDENGQFSFDHLQLEITSENEVDGPARVLFIEHPGYTKYLKAIPPQGYLKWGQQYEVDDILLEPNGFVYGYVEDYDGNPVKAEVFIGEFTSATTVQSQELQNQLGISGDLKEVFLIKAPSGENVELHIVPENPIFVPSDYSVDISENSTALPQDLGGFEVGLYKHRITLQVTEEEQFMGDVTQGNMTMWFPPVKNALVKVTNLLSQGPETNTKSSQPADPNAVELIGPPGTYADNIIYGYTDEDGYVTLSFSNNSQEFEIEVIPPVDKDLVKKTITIQSESSGQPVYAGRVVLEKAWNISGTVTYGQDSVPLANARVYIDDYLEAYTDAEGNYSLKYISQNFSEYTITAENQSSSLTLIADSKNIQFPLSGDLNFNLEEFSEFEINELMGIPVTVKSITPDGNNYLLDGAFINLPGNDNFSVKNTSQQLKFHQVPITGTLKNGSLVAQSISDSITLDEPELHLINYTSFLVKQTPNTGYQLMMMADENGSGSLNGKVTLMNSSFQFDEHYMSFNEGTSTQLINSNFILIQQSQATISDNIQRSYIDLFSSQSQLRLFDQQQNSTSVKTLSAAGYQLQSFGVSDQNFMDYEFKVQDFKAIARKEDSYVYQDSLVLATSLLAENIPLSIPNTLEVDVGNIVVSVHGFEEIIGSEPLTFNLEEWRITCDNWTLDPNVTGIFSPSGKIDFGLFTTEIKDIKILPNDLQLGALNLNDFKLGDIVPITIKANTVSFGIDNAAGSDNQPHWSMSIIGFNNQPAASIKGLPGMVSTDEIDMQEVLLLSNGEQEMIIGNQDKALTFYNIIKVTPDKFTMLDGGLQLSASLDLEIPLLQASYGSFRYTEENGILQSQFLGMDVDFTIPGNTLFVGDQILGSQTIQQNKFDAVGYIEHEGQVKLFTRLVKDLDSTYIYVDPLGQTLPIAENSSNYMAEITGGTKTIPGNWNKFVFSGDFVGMKGVEDSKKRKTFTINGSINAENEGLDVKNISADFGGMKITYDFKNSRLTGSLDFQQNFSSVQITGHADYLADSDGWLFIAGGSLTTPGFGKLNAGLGIGDYGNMNVLIAGNSIENRLLQEAYTKHLPDAFQSGFSGFFFTGMKSIPQLSIPETGFNFGIVKASIELVTGFDARLWMGFDDSGAEFGIGVMAFSHFTLLLDVPITCTSLYGFLGAELAVQGMYNTGNGVFSLDGCASLSIAGAIEQCFPVSAIVPIIPPVCEGCGTICESVGVKANFHFDSSGNIDAGFALGSCSGGNPLSKDIKDKFNCN